MTTHYTSSKGESIEIDTMVYSHLVSANKKAIASEERKHEFDPDYSNEAREAEIAAMTAEIAKRDAEYAAQQEAEANVRKD